MKRKDLEDLGLAKEQVDAIMKINGADIENAKEVAGAEVTNLKAENEGLAKQVKDRDKQLEELKKSSGDNEELKKQIETLQEDNKDAKAEYEKQIKQMQIDNAVQSALKDAGARNVTAVTALLKDLDKAEIDEHGVVKGLKEQIAAIQKDNDFLFESKETQTKPSASGITPQNGGQEPSAESSWSAKLAQARESGNTTEAIAIKREAFQTDGIVLM